jgi:Ras-related protein Rab-5C/Ras-related protein Rab-22
MTSYKIMLLGDIGVGKSSIAQRLAFERFSTDYKPTIGVDVYRYREPPAAGHDATDLIVWDTDGNLGDHMFRHIYMRAASGAMIVGDLTRRETLDSVVQLAEAFSSELPGRYIGFLLNKTDLIEKPETILLPKALVDRPEQRIFTSAKTGRNIVLAFSEAANAMRRRGY